VNVTATQEQLAAAFEEWDRRFREDPDDFANFATTLLTGDSATYGQRCAPYFTSILGDLGAAAGHPELPPAEPDHESSPG
jgi:hypothetical protein